MSQDTEIPDYDERELTVGKPKSAAAGITGVTVSLKRALERMGPTRTAKTLLKLNQADGFDCMSCAWGDPAPADRKVAEFCENGAKAVAEEATTTRATPEFFAGHSLAELDAHSELWLGQQGRITHPLIKRPEETHYSEISWDDAFGVIGSELNALDSPDEAVFYTSGRASNEAAFAYQLFARAFGTNNLPDCSNMCHESTSIALAESIGIGKGSVTMDDYYGAELIVIAGQNPGTNHPRMLTALETAKQNGAKILAINPLREAGLVNFHNPQTPKGMLGIGQDIADMHLPIRLNGDLALFQAIGHLLVEWDALDHDFIDRYTHGFDEWKNHVRDLDWDTVEASTGLSRAEITSAAEMFRESNKTITCWAMGITQHHNAVATVKEIVNVCLAQGNIGKPGAGLAPIRGHSNVQGDRTMGIWERSPQHFLDAVGAEFGFTPPSEHGFDTIGSVKALRDGKAKTFIGLGGNFVQAAPDTDVTLAALRKARLTVQISTKLNRSHLHGGEIAMILPTLGRTEIDEQRSGKQRITVEDSNCSVHASQGPLKPASPHLKSEVAIITGIAEATIGGRHGIRWKEMREDYTVIRSHISHVVPGCDAYDAKVRRPGGFVMPHPPRDSRTFETSSDLAEFAVTPIGVLELARGELLLQTMRSHDQFNTTIYGLSDRYRGIEGGRRVVFVNQLDIDELGLEDGRLVDIEAIWDGDDIERWVESFRVVAYATPRGCVAAYYPETNPLVALDHKATASNCPASKSVRIRLHPAGSRRGPTGKSGGESVPLNQRDKRSPQPVHLS